MSPLVALNAFAGLSWFKRDSSGIRSGRALGRGRAYEPGGSVMDGWFSLQASSLAVRQPSVRVSSQDMPSLLRRSAERMLD